MSLRFSQKFSVVKPSKVPDTADLSERENEIYCMLSEAKLKKDVDGMLESFLNTSDKDNIKSLIEKGFITETNEVKQRVRNETVRMIELSDEFRANEFAFNVSVKQQAVVDFLRENAAASVKELEYVCGVSRAMINGLLKKGVISDYESEKAKIYNRSKKPDKNLFKIIKFLINYPQNLETIGKMTYNRGMFGGRRRLKMRAD